MKIESPVSYGAALARAVFRKRGDHTEAHIKEIELAALLALAYDRGVKSITEKPGKSDA